MGPETTTVFDFDHPHADAPRTLTGLLGGKGAGLAEMSSVLGLPVPPGFTIGVPVCLAYRAGGWPSGLSEQIGAAMTRLQRRIGRRFGDPVDPLLVAVRSGAPRSMPGMLDTVLNLGLNDETVRGLAEVSGDEDFAWDSYRRFLLMYTGTVLGVVLPRERSGCGSPRQQVHQLKKAIADAGVAVPADPAAQLRGAVEAVFRSWDSPRAQAYRRHEGIGDDLGTAVNVQAMVFGNRGEGSGTGVVFTRDPSTGRPGAYGDFLPRAQGEDVVSGTARTLDIAAMTQHLPAADAQLRTHLARLERHYRDMCDVEFTVERGTLWILQTRVAKRGAVAAVRTAVAFAADPEMGLDHAGALARVPEELRERARAEVLAASAAAGTPEPVTTGLAASPGRVSGVAVFTADAAADADAEVILVRPETSPEDVHGMSVSVGVLTSRGGLVSHAAVVARGWGIPAVVGAQRLVVGVDSATDESGEVLFRAGDVITIDGATGQVWLGAVGGETTETSGTAATEDAVLARELPELAELQSWATAR